ATASECGPWRAGGWGGADERRNSERTEGRAASARAHRHARGEPASDLHHLVPRHPSLLARPVAARRLAGAAAPFPGRFRLRPERGAGLRALRVRRDAGLDDEIAAGLPGGDELSDDADVLPFRRSFPPAGPAELDDVADAD